MQIKLVTLLWITTLMQVSAAGFAQKITIKRNNITLEQLFSEIREQTGYTVLWSGIEVKAAKKINANFKDAPLEIVLKSCLDTRSWKYEIEDQVVVIKKKELSFLDRVIDMMKAIDVKGRVVGPDNGPMPGASVKVKGSNKVTTTNQNGEFFLNDVDEKAVLQISYMGYETVELNATANLSRIVMYMSDAKLEEVAVISTGYQKLPKERATGSFDVINAKAIENKIQTNVLERLEGMVPGMLMINGKASGNDDPLTIRGVSTLYGTKGPLIVVDNFPIEGDINTINPNDVESITVLKDAAAASIWGSRAANGVIVITTKQGKSGKASFQYTNSFQFTEKPDLGYLNRLPASADIDISRQLITINSSLENNAKSWGDLYSTYTGLVMDSIAGRLSPTDYAAAVNRLRGLDNSQQIKDLLMQQPFLQNHTLSLNGGNERNTFYSSINFTDRNSYSIKDGSKRYSFFIKSSHQLTERLKLGINTNLSYLNGSSAPVAPMTIFNLKPYDMIQDANGNPLAVKMQNGGDLGGTPSNPMTIAERLAWGLDDESYYPLEELNKKDITNTSTSQRFFAELNYKIAKGISANVSYQLEKSNYYSKTYTHRNQSDLVRLINNFVTPMRSGSVIQLNQDGTLLSPTFNVPQGGSIKEGRSDNTSYAIRASLNINKEFNDHAIAGIIGAERSAMTTTGNGINKFGYDDNTLNFVQLDPKTLEKIPTSLQLLKTGLKPFLSLSDYFSYAENRFVSAFANGSYTYKNKYIYSGSIRIDQTNLFGTDPKYLYRPMWSSGLSWIASREDFMSNLDFINHLQLRATYGFNGNVPKNSGPFMIARADVHFMNNNPFYYAYSPENASLRWEKTAVSNLGLDFTILNHRINGKVDYYLRKSTDLLGDEKVNPTYGFSTALLNTASMNNHGLEVQLTTKNIDREDFSWTSNFTWSKNTNKITKVALANAYSNPRELANNLPYIVGKPYGAMYSIRYGGLSHDKGQLQILDQNGNIEPPGFMNSNLDAAYYTGNTRPTSSGAFANSFRYKDLELNFMFVFYLGNVKRETTPMAAKTVAYQDGRLANAWKKPGDEAFTNIPNIITMTEGRTAMQTYRSFLDVNVFKADYAKLREVSLIYNINPQLFKGGYIKGLQISAQGRNLWTIVKNDLGIDPESFNAGMRSMRVMPTYALGMNLKF